MALLRNQRLADGGFLALDAAASAAQATFRMEATLGTRVVVPAAKTKSERWALPKSFSCLGSCPDVAGEQPVDVIGPGRAGWPSALGAGPEGNHPVFPPIVCAAPARNHDAKKYLLE